MTLLYDYSLFLEAVQDKKELIRVYDLLLPQVNYISSLFQRQLNLLIDAQKDSAVVELFAKGYEATGDKKMLLQQVQGLIIQKRNAEARAIVDTLSTVSEYEENMINLVLLVIAKDNRVGYCVHDAGYRKEGEWALNVTSVVVFGRITLVTDEEKAKKIGTNLCRKFTDDEAYIQKELQNALPRAQCLELTIDHMTGKLVNES